MLGAQGEMGPGFERAFNGSSYCFVRWNSTRGGAGYGADLGTLAGWLH